MNGIGKSEIALWNEADGFYYDVLDLPDGQQCPMKVFACGADSAVCCSVLETETLSQFPGFKKRTEWFIRNRPDLKKMLPAWRHQA